MPCRREVTVSNDTPANPAEIRAEIARTRSDLADTVEALAAKLDVKAQIGSRVSSAKDQMRLRAARAGNAVSDSADRFRDRVARQLGTGRHASVVRDSLPPGEADWETGTISGALFAEERRRQTRTQAIAAAGAAAVALLALAVWLVRRRQQDDP